MIFENYHITDQTTGQVTSCDSYEAAIQYVSALTPGTIVELKKVVESHTEHRIYGTITNPLPQAPSRPMKLAPMPPHIRLHGEPTITPKGGGFAP